jgi:glutamyl-tRNA synthetase
MGWEYPEIINIGRLGLEIGVLSKSVIRKGLEDGIYESWDDPRLGTLRALRRRGLQPETIREIMIQVGPKPINAALSWAQIASINRRNIEEKANRYYFVEDPASLSISGVDEEYLAHLPLHPDHPDRGTRTLRVVPDNGLSFVNISRSDSEGLRSSSIVRLMGLFNVEIMETDPLRGRFHSLDHQEARVLGASFIHWLPAGAGIEAEVVMPDASVVKGLAGQGCTGLKVDEMIQFERFGFVRVDRVEPFKAYFSHR